MTFTARSLTCLLLILLGACSSLLPTSNPTSVAPPTATRAPVIALALGGGGAKGFAHIGVIKVFESHGIKPIIVTGTSAGSFVGSLYASGKTSYELQRIAENFEEADVRDLTLSRQGIMNGKKLQDYVNGLIGNQTIEQFPIQFAAVATRLDNGEKTVFIRGNAGQAVRASCSIPNIFIPTTINGIKYVDGGLVSPIPVSAARDLGADIVIAVDISSRPKSGQKIGLFSLLDQTINIMGQQSINQELSGANVVIRPDVALFGTLDLTQKHTAILEGEKAAQAAILQINQAVQAFRSSPAALMPAPIPKLR